MKILTLLLSLFISFSAFAQSYPSKPVKIIVPFGAGGIADITIRIVAADLTNTLGQAFVIENMPGAGGSAAARAALSSPDDGHTLLLLTNGAAVSSALFTKLPYDPVKEFTPISLLGTFDFFLATNSASSIKSLSEMLKLDKAAQEALNIATIAVGSTQNLTARLFLEESKAALKIIPYKGTPDAITGLLRQDSHILVEGYSTLKATTEEGKFTILASSGGKRSVFTPNVPTIGEVIGKNFDVSSWNALAAPNHLEPAKVKVLNDAIAVALAKPDIKAKLLALGIEPQASSQQELGKRLGDDIAKWNEIIARLGIAKQ